MHFSSEFEREKRVRQLQHEAAAGIYHVSDDDIAAKILAEHLASEQGRQIDYAQGMVSAKRMMNTAFPEEGAA